MSSTMISALCWLPKQFLAEVPDQYELSPEELATLVERQKKLKLTNDDGTANHGAMHDSDSSESDSEDENDSVEETSDNDDEESSTEATTTEDNNSETVAATTDDATPAPPQDKRAAEEAFLKQIGMDQYDDEEEEEEGDAALDEDEEQSEDEGDEKDEAAPSRPRQSGGLKAQQRSGLTEDDPSLWLGGKSLTVYADNRDDPYITIGDSEDDDSDDESLIIQPTDCTLLVANTEDEVSNLEVHIYDPTSGDLYVHHDFPLPDFPLCLQPIDIDPRSKTTEIAGNESKSEETAATATSDDSDIGAFVAIGTIDGSKGIEIWNLDVVDAMEPVAVLGGPSVDELAAAEATRSKKGKKQSLKQSGTNGHTDAITTLSWHAAVRHRLASGSADHSIKVWDLKSHQCTHTFSYHDDELITLQWNPQEPHVLLSADEHTVCMYDIRAEDTTKVLALRFSADSSIEYVRWNPHQPTMFIITFESGEVQAHDATKLTLLSKITEATPITPPPSRLFAIAAHDEAATSVAFHSTCPSLIATSSLDKSVKVWDISDNQITMLASRQLNVGKLYTVSFDVNPDTPFMVAAGGDKGKLALWDVTENKGIAQRYSEFIKQTRHATIQHEDESKMTFDLSTAAGRRKAEKARRRAELDGENGDSRSEASDSDAYSEDEDMLDV